MPDTTIRANWFHDGRDRSTAVHDPREASALLQRLARPVEDEPPIVLFARSEDGPFLGVGASDPTVLTFDPSLDPPSFVSATVTDEGDGPDAADVDGGVVAFTAGGEEVGFARRELVSSRLAEGAVAAFFATPERPDHIAWREA